MKLTQRELLDEGFWDSFKKNPIKGTLRAGLGLGMGLAKAGVKTLDYIAPQITNPIHNIKAAAGNIGQEFQKGWAKGVGGREGEAEEVLRDYGYKYVPGTLTKTGKNLVAQANEIVGHDSKGNEMLGKVHRILFDKDMNVLDLGGKGKRDYMVAPYKIRNTAPKYRSKVKR